MPTLMLEDKRNHRHGPKEAIPRIGDNGLPLLITQDHHPLGNTWGECTKVPVFQALVIMMMGINNTNHNNNNNEGPKS